MTISLRLDENERKQLEQMKQSKGLSTTAVIKKCLFEPQGECQVNKNILVELGDVSTNVNLMKHAIENENFSEAAKHISTIEEGVDSIWQLL